MIKIVVNNEILRLTDKTELSLEFNNPAMIDNIVLGDYSYPFDLVWDEEGVNRRALNFPDLTENNFLLSSIYSAELTLGSKTLHGVVKLIRATPKGASLSFSAGLGVMNAYLEGKTLSDFEYNDVVISSVPKVVDCRLIPVTSNIGDPVSLTINSKGYSSTYNGSWADCLNEIKTKVNNDAIVSKCTLDIINISTYSFRLTATKAGPENQFDSSNIAVPVSIGGGFVIDEDTAWAWDHSQDLVSAVNNLSTFSPDYSAVTFFPMYNSQFYSDALTTITPSFYPFLNYYNAGSFVVNMTGLSSINSNSFTLVPFVYLKTVLTAMFKTLPFDVKSKFLFEDSDIKTIVIYNSVSIDSRALLQTFSGGAKIINLFKSRFNPKDHLPSTLATDLLSSLRKTFNLLFDYDYTNNVLVVEPNIVSGDKSEEIDITDKASSDYELEPVLSDGWTFSFTPDPNDSELQVDSGTFKNLVIGEGKTEINAGMCSFEQLYIVDSKAGGGRTLLIPKVGQPGNSVAFSTGTNEFGLRLIFYRGYHNDSNGNPYPLATQNIYDLASTVIGHYSLQWYGDNGLYECFYKEWCEIMLNGRLLRIPAMFDSSDIAMLRYSVPYRFKASRYMLSKLGITVSSEDISAAILELLRIPAND